MGTTDPPPPATFLRERREQAVQALTRHYASEVLDLDEFERRLDQLYRARSVAEIEEVQSDLPGLADPDPPAPATVGPGEDSRRSQLVIALMGGTERKGSWSPARRVNAVAIMGGVFLDFREARLAPGVTELDVLAMMGGIEIVVPPGLRVECEGVGLLGGFEALSQDDAPAVPGAPTLRIRGLAMFGGVEVTQRYPGESAKDRKRRLKDESHRRKELGP